MNYGDYSYIEWYPAGGGNMLPPSGAPRSTNYFSMWIRPVQIAKQLKAQYSELSGINIGHAHFAIRMAIRELDNLVTNGMTKKAFEDTRQFLQSYIKLYIQRPSDQLGYLMDANFYGRKDYIADMEKLLAKLTLNDVNKAIKKYWQIKNMDITIVTDVTEAEPLAKSLQENLPSPMTYSNLVKSGQPKDVLAEDDVVANYKLNINSVKIVKNEDTFK
jgi:zinc protease